jgi:hypothetical protein
MIHTGWVSFLNSTFLVIDFIGFRYRSTQPTILLTENQNFYDIFQQRSAEKARYIY